MITRLIAVCVCLMIACAGASSVDLTRIMVGNTAPEFVLPDMFSNERVSSPKIVHNHNATVITFWSMACPSCREALAEVEKVYEEYSRMTMAFLGINFDTENLQGVRAFVKGEGIKFPMLWDSGQRVTRSYRAVDYTFSVFVVDRNGKVVLVQYDHPPDLATLLAETLDQVLGQQVE